MDRFLAEENISCPELLDRISRATIERFRNAESEYMLLVQGTGYFGSGELKNPGGPDSVRDLDQRGMRVHSCIAVTDQGLPVGLVYQESCVSEPCKELFLSREQRRARPVEEKESYRWIHTLNEIHQRVPEDTARITVCDGEGDFYELFSEADRLDEYFLVRLTQNRLIDGGGRLFDTLKSSAVDGTVTVKIGKKARDQIPQTEISLDYHFQTVTVYCPLRRKEKHLRESLNLTAIYAHESGEKGKVQWFLLTNAPVVDKRTIEKYIQYYAYRWNMERFHYVLKGRDGIRERKTERPDELRLSILRNSVIALQIMNLAYMEKACPELPCEAVFDDMEWKVLYCSARKTQQLKPDTYTVRDAVCDLGTLGGMKRAAKRGMPDVRSAWRGLEKLHILLAYREFLV